MPPFATAPAQLEVSAALAALREQSVRKYAEAVVLWMHMKAVRVFVESVLRYGLPSEYGPGKTGFAVALLVFVKGGQKRGVEAAKEAWASGHGGGKHDMLDDAYGGAAAGGAGHGEFRRHAYGGLERSLSLRRGARAGRPHSFTCAHSRTATRTRTLDHNLLRRH